MSAAVATSGEQSFQYAEINGYSHRLRIQGSGPLVVFGHGLLGSIEQIEEAAPQLAELLEHVRLLTYDARGHGKSDGPEDSAGYTWETLGRDMSAMITFAGEEQAIIGGASMGAATALWVALEQPKRVRALTLMMPPPLGAEPMRAEAEKQALTVLDLLAAAVQNFGIEKTVEIAQSFPGFAPTPEEAHERAQWLLQQNPLTLLYAIRGLITAPFHDPERYRDIKVPTLVLAHEGDGLHPVRAARLLGDTIPDCEVVIASHPGHWQAHPEELRELFSKFLERINSALPE
ncbi:MAG: alpha/beta hydrolase [Tepidiformaceae bacterium]